MQQLELFDYRKDYLFDNKNQVAHWYDILKETEDTISYAEHIDPNKGYAIAGMEYEEYVDVKKDRLKGLTYDQILAYLKSAKKEDRLKKYKALLKFKNIPFEADLFTWHNDDL
tara:strand:- start:757 stop:1095 length:339 start_codon:yes stop_codon:yes gene_type:complete